jgi:hypothetical protein
VRPPCEPLGAAETAELRAALDALPPYSRSASQAA